MMVDIESQYRALGGPLIGTLRREGLSPEDAEDVAAEAWLRAWQHQATLRANVWPWVLTVARRIFIDQRRRTRHHPSVALDESLPTPMDTEHEAVANLASAAALEMIDTLPAAQRTVMVLRVLEWSYAEIATALDCPTRRLRVNHHRGRRRLAAMMERGAA